MGVIALIEAAQAFSVQPPKRSVIIAAVTGEEVAWTLHMIRGFLIEVHTSVGKVHIVSIDVPALESSRIQLPLDLDSKPVKLVFDPQVDLLATIKSK